MARTRTLDPLEIRVVGALMEKEQTTPDYYPMTLNALVAACNQKSNRDPVMNLTRQQVQETLERLRQDVLVWRSEGARSERWQHSLDRRWALDGGAKAIMTLLLLRGAQTPGELRSRSERMHAFATVGEVEEVLQRLQEGFDALVRELPRAPGQRENRWIHLVGREETGREETAAVSVPAVSVPVSVPAVSVPVSKASTVPASEDSAAPASEESARPAPLPAPDVDRALVLRLQRLEETSSQLEQVVEALAEELKSLRQRLGDA